MRDSGVHLKLHQGTESSEVVFWLKTPTEFAWSTDLAVFPPAEHFTVPFFDIASITAGKASDALRAGLAQWAHPDCCFSIQLTAGAGGGTLDFESSSSDEACTFIEGVNMLLVDLQHNGGGAAGGGAGGSSLGMGMMGGGGGSGGGR